jgi:hypothetical protein
MLAHHGFKLWTLGDLVHAGRTTGKADTRDRNWPHQDHWRRRQRARRLTEGRARTVLARAHTLLSEANKRPRLGYANRQKMQPLLLGRTAAKACDPLAIVLTAAIFGAAMTTSSGQATLCRNVPPCPTRCA